MPVARSLLVLFVLLCPQTLWAGNILLIIADDMGVDKVGVYGEGQDPPPTPTIDALAENGLLFRNAWSNPLCSSTRAGILTGRHAFRTGVVNSLTIRLNSLKPSEVTLPEVLSSVGYNTALFGKSHVGIIGGLAAPAVIGWDHHAGVVTGGVLDYFAWAKTTNGLPGFSLKYATTDSVDDALEWIDDNEGQSWFCSVSFVAPHIPFHAPPDDLHNVDLDGSDLQFYNAMVEAMDTEIGRLLESVPADTTVIFAGDDGTTNEVILPPFDASRGKGTVYEGGVNVPLIISSPLVTQPGREVEALVHTIDLFATIAELAGADASTGVDSVSMVPYLTSADTEPLRETVYTEVESRPLPCSSSLIRCSKAVRDVKYKLLVRRLRFHKKYELYDLETDPFEQTNLLRHPRTQSAQEAYERLRPLLH